MKKLVYLLRVLIMHPSVAVAEEEKQDESRPADAETDEAWRYTVRLSKLERQFSPSNDDDYGEWAGFIMAGTANNKLWLTIKGSTQLGETDSAEIRFFYSHTLRPHIDVQLGWRRDLKPEPERDWLGFGLLGVMP